MIKAVIFDIDNTLMDFMRMKRAAVEGAVEAMIDAGLPVVKEEMVKKIFDVYWKEGVEDQNIFDKVFLKEFGHVDYKILAAGILGYRRAKEGHMTLYPHVHLTLTQLMKMGIKMAVVSDAPRLPVWLRIVQLGIHHYFDHVVTMDDTGVKKPDPKPFLKVLELLKVKPEETLMVGDWAERDIAGAKNLKIKTVWAKYGDEFHTQESGADYELKDIQELISIIEKENGLPKESYGK
ncbi:MAG: TIGR02253 family HAD-type hydrolase [Elusimicrobia bacterium]|nr:TIGR02253 family HAD-type hydrolase [Elusimicrobiota bacterium]